MQNSVTCKGPASLVVLLSGGVTGKRENKRKNRLKVPCMYRTKDLKHMAQNVEFLINEYLERTKYRI